MDTAKETAKNKTVTDRIWDLFASVKLAIIIFSLIALTSMVGTILEQDAEPAKNIKILAKFFGDSAAQPAYDFLARLGFMDMYHSWWFVGLQLLFAANLVICSLDRLPRIWKLVKEPVRPLAREYVERMSIKKSLTVRGVDAVQSASSALKEIGFTPEQAAEGKEVRLYAEKGNYSRLGVYITHLSILVILLGAIIGVFFGFNGTLPLPEGEMASFAFKGPDKRVPLGFDVRCDKFEVEYYGDSDMPKAYKSWLTIIKDGREVKKKMISVNDPLSYEGITFYQSSFGVVPGAEERGVVVMKAVLKDGKSEDITARPGGTFSIPGTAITGRIANFSPALALDQSGRPFTYDKNIVNPAIYVEFSGGGGNDSRWILKRYPQTWNLPDGNRLEFVDYWGAQYTGLQVRKDPGVFLVYLGCIIMAIGLYITFFMSHRRVWISVMDEKGGASILIGASTNRNRAAFESKIEKLAGLISGRSKGGK